MQRPEPATIPVTPGVYIYKDARGRVLYVGKARILRRRVLSYFRPNGLADKTQAMLRRAESIEYLTTTSEKEALLLEANLIKRYRPPYNIVLRDDKQYVLFRLDMKQAFPRLEIVRNQRRDGARYFGPFTSAMAARETWKLIHRAFPLRRCPDRSMKNRVRACLYHHMSQCPAPCMGQCDKAEYEKSVRKICDLLSGNGNALLTRLKADMEAAADALDFERAAILRDQMRAVEKTIEKQAAVLPGAADMDAVGLFESENGLALGLVFLRNGQVTDSRAFFWPSLGYDDAPELLSAFITQFYGKVQPPPRVLLPWMPAGFEHAGSDGETGESAEDAPGQSERVLLEQFLAERRNGQARLVAPQNAADNQLVDLAQANAREEARRRRSNDPAALLHHIRDALFLQHVPCRIECVDVSHTGGKQTYVGMIVYQDGLPCREEYRLYGMPDSNDDYATLHAWVGRRLESGPPWPDLLLIDGGRGQLASVARGLADAGKAGLFPLASIAKARDEHGHADRRAGNVSDRIFVPNRSNPLPLKAGSRELLFLQQIRDATHQYAISGHRKARRGAALSGELMRLPGVGPATARLLWDKFKNIEAMTKASQEDLQSIPGIGKLKAKSLVEKLQKLA